MLRDARSGQRISGHRVQDFTVTGAPQRLVAGYFLRPPLAQLDMARLELHGAILSAATGAPHLTPCAFADRPLVDLTLRWGERSLPKAIEESWAQASAVQPVRAELGAGSGCRSSHRLCRLSAITVQWSIAGGHPAPMGPYRCCCSRGAPGGASNLSSSPTSRWRGRTVAVLLAAAVPLAASGSVAQAAPTAQARLASVARKTPNRKVTAIVQFKRGVSERKARALVRSHHGRVTDRLPSINGFAIRLPARDARALRRSRQVLNLTLNTRVRSTGVDAGSLATNYPKTIGADKLWAAGITGKGVGVAVIDSGISGDMPDFKNADGSSRITANVIANPGATRPGDDIGHGTHVAGIIAGNSFNRDAGDPARGAYVGIAPEATWSRSRSPTTPATRPCWTSSRRCSSSSTTRTTSTSASSTSRSARTRPRSYRDDPLDAAVEFAWHAGIVVVAAAGNRGDAADAVDYAPGNDPYVISVGATDEAGTVDPGDDTTAVFSSRGVTQDGVSKPDVLAPGARIVAPLAPGSAFQSLCRSASSAASTCASAGRRWRPRSSRAPLRSCSRPVLSSTPTRSRPAAGQHRA